MPDDRFEARLRALAQQLSRSISEVDLEEVADRLGVDPDRVRGAAGAVEDWLSDRANPGEPLFSTGPGDPREYRPAEPAPHEIPSSPPRADGPHPLDLPTDDQARALSALASGRWTVRAGSGRLSSTEPPVGPPAPDQADLAGELRARDWITADGTVTLVGREALLRWCQTAHTGADRARVAHAGAEATAAEPADARSEPRGAERPGTPRAEPPAADPPGAERAGTPGAEPPAADPPGADPDAPAGPGPDRPA